MKRPHPSPPCIVTRAAPESARWVEQLRAHGVDACALPLIEIEACAEASPPLTPGAAEAFAALMFVSPAAVEHFFKPNKHLAPVERQKFAMLNIANGRCWAPGPGTAAALREAGVPAARIDAPPPDALQFDSEALWTQVRPQVHAGQRVLLVRGADAQGQASGRDWLEQTLISVGVQVQSRVVYRRLAPRWSADERAQARAALDGGVLWLFSSSEAIDNLRAALPQANWQAGRALATHPRIAETARNAGFGAVSQAPPRLEAIVASIKSQLPIPGA